jgi:hypothetical protein
MTDLEMFNHLINSCKDQKFNIVQEKRTDGTIYIEVYNENSHEGIMLEFDKNGKILSLDIP